MSIFYASFWGNIYRWRFWNPFFFIACGLLFILFCFSVYFIIKAYLWARWHILNYLKYEYPEVFKPKVRVEGEPSPVIEGENLPWIYGLLNTIFWVFVLYVVLWGFALAFSALFSFFNLNVTAA